MSKIPVILDTDIGGDIDDVWALAFLLRCPELDVRLVTTVVSERLRRAKLVSKLLAAAGRQDVPIGMGLETVQHVINHGQWADDWDLATHRGSVHEDGVAAMIRTIMDSREPVTIIAIGPLTNLAAAVERDPRITERCKVVAMAGSVFKGYGDSSQPSAEYNIHADIVAAQKVFAAGWHMTITPLDTCGLIKLEGDKYAMVRDSSDPLAKAVIENYRLWCRRPGVGHDADKASSVLYDAVAVYLAFSHERLEVSPIGLSVDERGFTVPDKAAKAVDIAVAWRDLQSFEDLLVRRLCARRLETDCSTDDTD